MNFFLAGYIPTLMNRADKVARCTDGLPHSPALVEEATSSAEPGTTSGVGAAAVVSRALCAPDDLTEPDKLHLADAEASGRIIVKQWDAIGEEGVFAGPMPIAAGQTLGALEGIIVRRRRLTRAERRRFIGIRVDGRAAHIDVEDRWPGKINHAPPGRANTDWDPDTFVITATRDIQPGEQVFICYGVGYWVDALMNRDYERLPKDQRAFFDMMHAVVDNYALLSNTLHQRKFSQATRVGIIALYLFQLCLGSYHLDKSPTFTAASSQARVAVQDTNPLMRYLLDCGMDLQRGGPVGLQADESVSDRANIYPPTT